MELDYHRNYVLVVIPCLESTDRALSYLIHVHFQCIDHHKARLVEGQIVAGKFLAFDGYLAVVGPILVDLEDGRLNEEIRA